MEDMQPEENSIRKSRQKLFSKRNKVKIYLTIFLMSIVMISMVYYVWYSVSLLSELNSKISTGETRISQKAVVQDTLELLTNEWLSNNHDCADKFAKAFQTWRSSMAVDAEATMQRWETRLTDFTRTISRIIMTSANLSPATCKGGTEGVGSIDKGQKGEPGMLGFAGPKGEKGEKGESKRNGVSEKQVRTSVGSLVNTVRTGR